MTYDPTKPKNPFTNWPAPSMAEEIRYTKAAKGGRAGAAHPNSRTIPMQRKKAK